MSSRSLVPAAVFGSTIIPQIGSCACVVSVFVAAMFVSSFFTPNCIKTQGCAAVERDQLSGLVSRAAVRVAHLHLARPEAKEEFPRDGSLAIDRSKQRGLGVEV